MYKWAPHPIRKLHNVLIVGTKVSKSTHITNTTAKTTQTHKYIQTHDTTKQNAKPKKTLTNIHKTKYNSNKQKHTKQTRATIANWA